MWGDTAKSLADRLDFGEISLPPTPGELELVKDILAHQINKPKPNLVRHIYKLRRGKLTKVRVYQYANLSTCRTEDLFVTDYEGKLIPVEITQLQNTEDLDKIIDEHSVDSDEIQVTKEEQEEATKALFNW